VLRRSRRMLIGLQVGTLVTLYSSQEDQSSAADVFSKTISWYQNNDVSSIKLRSSMSHVLSYEQNHVLTRHYN